MFIGCFNGKEPADQGRPTLEMTKPYSPTYSKEFLMGKFDPETHSSFVEIAPEYADRKGRWIISTAYEAFIKMHAAAKADGVDLKIISAARNFDYQKGIWERKWQGRTMLEGKIDATTIDDPSERARAIMQYSAMPGGVQASLGNGHRPQQSHQHLF